MEPKSGALHYRYGELYSAVPTKLNKMHQCLKTLFLQTNPPSEDGEHQATTLTTEQRHHLYKHESISKKNAKQASNMYDVLHQIDCIAYKCYQN